MQTSDEELCVSAESGKVSEGPWRGQTSRATQAASRYVMRDGHTQCFQKIMYQ